MLLMIGSAPSFMENPSLASVPYSFLCGVWNASQRTKQQAASHRCINKLSNERAVLLKNWLVMACWKVRNSDLGFCAQPHSERKRAERAAIARERRIPKPHPLVINAVASVKHCSILAPSVLCSPLS